VGNKMRFKEIMNVPPRITAVVTSCGSVLSRAI
jgi:hypothetical protein